MVRALVFAALAAFTPLVPGAGAVVPAAHGEPPARPTAVVTTAWTWPLAPDPEVVGVFHAPPTPWSAGHRGVDLAAAVGQPVLSAGRGRVTFAASVAGRGVVVVLHAGGLRTSYEPVDDPVPVGTLVQPGSRLAVVSGVPGHCAPSTCLHWGLRRGEVYLDPLRLVRAGPPVLLPLSPPSPR
jgi:murein DD-endopeptidase MepM/ murein hydrolase activator NlpD